MIELLDPIARRGVTWLLTYLLHSTVLLGVAWTLVRAGLVRRPTSRELVWKVAALAALVTATTSVARPGNPRALVRLSSVAERSTEVIRTHRLELTASVTEPPAECRRLLRSIEPGHTDWLRRARNACGVRAGLEWYHGLLLVWGLGACLVLVREVRGYVALRRLRARLEPAPPRVRALLDAVTPSAWRGRIRVGSLPDLASPCVVGRHTVALPVRCATELPDQELRAALAHEVAHLARRDFEWTVGLRLACALLWLQPLNRLALEGLVAAAEHACDDWALSRTSASLGLARSLARVAEWSFGQRAAGLEVAMARPSDGGISGRVRRILHGREPSGMAPRWRRLALAALLVPPVAFLPAVGVPGAPSVVVVREQVLVGPETPEGSAFWVGEGVAASVRAVRLRQGSADAPTGELNVLIRRGSPGR